MAQILVRDLKKDVVERLKKRARADGRSLQSEVKFILERAAFEPKVDMATVRKKIYQRGFPARMLPSPDRRGCIGLDRCT